MYVQDVIVYDVVYVYDVCVCMVCARRHMHGGQDYTLLPQSILGVELSSPTDMKSTLPIFQPWAFIFNTMY